MDNITKQAVKEKVELSKDLSNEVFLRELHSMEEDYTNFKKRREHVQKVIERAQLGRALTATVQEEARKNPGRIQPIFNFENDADWQVANAELAKLKQDVELIELDSEIRGLHTQLDTCAKEVDRLEETIKQFQKEKETRGC